MGKVNKNYGYIYLKPPLDTVLQLLREIVTVCDYNFKSASLNLTANIKQT